MAKRLHSFKHYYDLYDTKISLGKFSRRDHVRIVPEHLPEIRVNRVFKKDENNQITWTVNIYTSNKNIVEHYEKNYHVLSIHEPINEQHSDILSGKLGADKIFRENLYYKKYRYKLEVDYNWRNKRFSGSYAAKPTEYHDMIEDMYRSIVREHKNNDFRLVHRAGFFPNMPPSHQALARQSQPYIANSDRLQYLPFLFTNDEALLFMLKLKYTNEILRMRIVHVFTPNDVK